MRPLATTQLMMTWLSMCSANESTTLLQKIVYIAHTLAVFIINLSSIATSSVYCIKYFSIDLNGAMFGIMVIIGDFGMIYFMIAAILMRHQIDGIFASSSTIYKSRKYTVVN